MPQELSLPRYGTTANVRAQVRVLVDDGHEVSQYLLVLIINNPSAMQPLTRRHRGSKAA